MSNNQKEYQAYVVTFQRDREDDCFIPGGFTFKLPIPLLKEHKGSIIGYVTKIKENDQGLIATFTTDSIVEQCHLSLGFVILKKSNLWYRRLTHVKIIEISLVKSPAQYGTNII